MLSWFVAAILGKTKSEPLIVFAATRYVWRGKHVYPAGVSHLYRINLDGTGLRQLTHSSGDDIRPELSRDKRRIVFIRSFEKMSRVSRCTIDIDGGHLKRLKNIASSNSYMVPPSWSYPDTKPYRIVAYGEESCYLLDRKGKLIRDLGNVWDPMVSPDESRVVLNWYRGDCKVVNLYTGGVSRLPNIAGNWVWLDNDTLLAEKRSEHGDEQGTGVGAIANAKGELLSRFNTKEVEPRPHEEHGDDFQRQWGIPDSLNKAFRLPGHPHTALTWTHMSFSSGSAGFTSIDNFQTGEMRMVDDQQLYDLTPDGANMVTATREWVGGYKRAGSESLNRLFVWDVASLKSKRIGLRWMRLAGACFVPSGR